MTGARLIIIPMLLGLAVALLFHGMARSEDGQTWNHYGVTVNQRDIDIREMAGLCDLHPLKADANGVAVNGDWWPDPCVKVKQRYRDSGAQGRWEEIERRDRARQLDMVKKALQ